MPMTTADQQEAFSRAYVHTICAVAGCTHSKMEHDIDKIDLTIHGTNSGPNLRFTKPKLDIQLKCRLSDELTGPVATPISYSLDIETYNNLRDSSVTIPRILLVVLVPHDVPNWIDQNETNLLLRRCGYWLNLAGMPETENETTKTVHLPRSNVFTPAELRRIMTAISEGQPI